MGSEPLLELEKLTKLDDDWFDDWLFDVDWLFDEGRLDETGVDDRRLDDTLEFGNAEELELPGGIEDWRELFCEPPLEPPHAETINNTNNR